MDNQEQRDIAEEEYNRRTCPECDGQHESDEPCKDGLYGISNYPARDTGKWSESDNYAYIASESDNRKNWLELDEEDNSDKWDGSARNQTNDFFIGHSGHVTVLWQITNNPFERYDSRLTYQMPALDGSALYVYCDLKYTDSAALSHIQATSDMLLQIDADVNDVHRLDI